MEIKQKFCHKKRNSAPTQLFVVNTNLLQGIQQALYGFPFVFFYVNSIIVQRGNVAWRRNPEAKQKAVTSHKEIKTIDANASQTTIFHSCR